MTEPITQNSAETVARLVKQTAHPIGIDAGDGRTVVAFPPGWEKEVYQESDAPLHHVRAKAQHQTLESFATYVNRYASAQSATVGVDLKNEEIVAILDGARSIDDDEDPYAGWGHHRAEFEPLATSAMTDLENHLNAWMTREAFADLIARRLDIFTDPADSHLLALAQQLNVSSSAEFSAGEDRADGTRTIHLVEAATATAGGAHDFAIPAALTVELQPFYDSRTVEIVLAFRYKVRDKGLEILLEFANITDLKRDLFEDYVVRLQGLGDNDDEALADDVNIIYGELKIR